MKFYLSKLHVYHTESKKSVTGNDSLCSKSVDGRTTLEWLLHEYGMEVCQYDFLPDGTQAKDEIFPCTELTIPGMIKEIGGRTLSGMAPGDIEYVAYCHHLHEELNTITPSMKIKNELALKKSLSFAIEGCGHPVSLRGLEILQMFLKTAAPHKKGLLAAADRVNPLYPRKYFSQFPYGDAAATVVISQEPGDLEIVDCHLSTWSIGTNNQWDFGRKGFEDIEREWLNRAVQQLINAMADPNLRPDYVIVQHVSDGLLEGLQQACPEANLYLRSYHAKANFMSADPWYGLYELMHSSKFQRGERVMLIFIGPLGALGILHASRT
ncbi:hypothetical protein [Paenibacillus sp.]|jgi:3-oxoacyl-[acyl-carrier-protein] synthase III|uniref:hypothetical protein n=1 Tax=Paenibacillus sp. TaxID=58172 RepID=UPI0028257890|nr:hypothetical protein [Paenibacillus sp.]MDR0267464.1 hypothetical protein [Paenibacillus sp.]